MSSVRVVVLTNRIPDVKRRARTVIEKVALQAAENVNTRASELMHEPKSGRHYPHLPNRSSAPGEAPAVQSGELAGSLTEAVIDNGAMAIAQDPKAVWLEFGTERIAPRPFYRPAADEERPKFTQALAKELKRLER